MTTLFILSLLNIRIENCVPNHEQWQRICGSPKIRIFNATPEFFRYFSVRKVLLVVDVDTS